MEFDIKNAEVCQTYFLGKVKSLQEKTEILKEKMETIEVHLVGKEDLKDFKEEFTSAKKENKEDLQKIQILLKDYYEKLDEKLNHPKEGIYARIQSIEIWKSLHTKLNWLLIAGFIGLLGAILKQLIVG